MKTVPVKFISAEVASYNARDEHLEIRILLNDGKDKQMIKQLHIEDPSGQANEILKEVREKLMKALASGPNYDDNPLSGIVNIRSLQDEELVEERLAKFIVALREKIRNAKRKNISYYDLEQQMRLLKTDFG
ncbi:MAG: hypothetical protein QXT19_02070 [Candidatus Woesearchaeota archaeon]